MRRGNGGMRRMLLPLALAAIVPAGCSGTPDAPGTVTADEDRQLNEAAAMLDANSVSANALADDGNAQ